MRVFFFSQIDVLHRCLQIYTLLFYFTGEKFEYDIDDSASYKVIMRLHINSVTANDFGSYKCLAKNSLGETDGSIKLYSKFGLAFSSVSGFLGYL